MKFSYTVKHDGVIYPAGTEVPVGKEVEAPKAEVKEVEVKPAKTKASNKKTKK